MERALTTALPHLLKEWPQLPAMLLRGAVSHLAAAGGAAGAAESSGPEAQQGAAAAGVVHSGSDGAAAAEAPQAQQPEAAAWLLWVGRLLPAAAAQAAGGGAAPSRQHKAAAVVAPSGWAPSPALLRELVALCLPSLVRCSQQAAVGWALQPCGIGIGEAPAAGGGAGAVEGAAALHAVLRLLLESWRSVGGSAAEAARFSALLDCIPEAGAAASQPTPPGEELQEQQGLLAGAQQQLEALRAMRSAAQQAERVG